MDIHKQISSTEDFKLFMKTLVYYPDADELIKNWMKRNSYKLVPVLPVDDELK